MEPSIAAAKGLLSYLNALDTINDSKNIEEDSIAAAASINR